MSEPIAIVGRGCVLPGALDPDRFWDNVAAARHHLEPVAGFEEVFDPGGFAVPPDEITPLDPLFRWTLHTGRQALREAGLAGRRLPRAGLVLGNLSYPSTGLTSFAEQVWRAGRAPTATDPRNRFSSGLPAHFAAEALGLGLGGFALDAACASALYAIKLAGDRLRDGTADLMLAGAVTCPDRLLIRDGFRALSAASPTGRSRPFHRAADGLVPGEGAVLVALTRLSDAVRDGREILGVIRGIGLSNDGSSGGLLAPAQAGQERAMRLAYAEAGLPPESVSLVECHATGTAVGDAVEARSLARVFAGSPDLPVGSAKSNVGHLLAAAGGAGLLKVLGAIRAGQRPPSPADDPIDELRIAPLRLLTALEPWPGPRRAAVSAFGFGGTNAHLIVEAWEPGPAPPTGADASSGPLAVTALGVRVGDSDGTEDFRRALLLGERRPGPRDTIDLTVTGLRFPPRDLERAHAQQVLLLATAREATGGMRLPRDRTMVVAGMGTDPEVCRYPVARRAAPGAEGDELTGADVLGTMPNLVANRLNVQLDLGGPGFTVSAEEASGLVALELAGRALRAGEVDAAIVAAVDLSCEPVHEAALRGLGHDRPSGDAAVVLVLERLADARRDGHPVLAVLEDGPAEGSAGSGVEFIIGDGNQVAFDPAELFGAPHAATGLLAVAAAVTAIQHQAIPRPGRAAVPVSGALVAHARAKPLGGPAVGVWLRSGAPAVPW
ncbi:MAG: beta-ketoacyl synthase N-terminal-like domain-containing protein, partial [Actinoplanes sp.]